MKNNTIDAKLLNAEVAIVNASNNEVIRNALGLYGYSESKLLASKTMLDETKLRHANQKKEYGEQFEASQKLDSVFAKATKLYMNHLKIARVVLKDDMKSWEGLQMKGRRKKTYSGFVAQASIFYTNALGTDSVKTALTEFGISEEVLNTAFDLIKEVQTNLAQRTTEKGEAQEATVLRDQALDELMDWMSDFTVFAKIALEDNPQLLEILGIVEPAE